MTFPMLKLNKSTEETKSCDVVDTQQSTLRTVEPDNKQIPRFSRGVNLLKLVKDYADVELEEMDFEIATLQGKLQALTHKRQFVQRLREVASAYTAV